MGAILLGSKFDEDNDTHSTHASKLEGGWAAYYIIASMIKVSECMLLMGICEYHQTERPVNMLISLSQVPPRFR